MCTTLGCSSPSFCKGLCKRCYARQASRKRRATPEGRAESQRLNRESRARNPGRNLELTHQRRATAEGREAARAATRRYHHTEVGLQKKRDSMGRRRAQTNGGDAVDLGELYLRDGGLCHICCLLVDERDWHLEHVVPLSKGGLHVWGNVAVSHPACNLRKGVQLMSGFPDVLETALQACGLVA